MAMMLVRLWLLLLLVVQGSMAIGIWTCTWCWMSTWRREHQMRMMVDDCAENALECTCAKCTLPPLSFSLLSNPNSNINTKNKQTKTKFLVCEPSFSTSGKKTTLLLLLQKHSIHHTPVRVRGIFAMLLQRQPRRNKLKHERVRPF